MIGHVIIPSALSLGANEYVCRYSADRAMSKGVHGAEPISRGVNPSSFSSTLPVSDKSCEAHLLNPAERQHDVGSIIASHRTVVSADSLATIDRPPDEVEGFPPAKIYHPYSIHVLALLMPASAFGVLARLGLQALVTYDGQSIFPLAYVQATGCFIMGVALGMKTPFGNL